MSARTFLLLNLALAFYNVGTIWAHEVDIFRTWKLLEDSDFHRVQRVHWGKLPYWIFTPVGLALFGGLGLIAYHPAEAPRWAIVGAAACQVISLVLTAAFWGRWQSRLAQDPLGARSPYLARILSTHWVRTLLITACALFLLVAALGG